MTDLPIALAMNLFPVLAFLAGLVVLDSFKLVALRDLGVSFVGGTLVAGAAFGLNRLVLAGGTVDELLFVRYVAPLVEEAGKLIVVILLLRRHRIGFLVDAAIHGFAVGAGFAVVENLYYVFALPEAGLWTWLLRGFGTALMHGGATAAAALLTKTLRDRRPPPMWSMLPGLAIAFLVHSVYNHFILPAWLAVLLLLLVLPATLVVVFAQSEALTRRWLGDGFDLDQSILALIDSGRIEETPLGRYLDTLRRRFHGEVLVDMICLLRLSVELSIRAKGELLMQEAGFRPPPDPDVQAKLDERAYLERSIGRTGLLALDPILNQDLLERWQVHRLARGRKRE